MATSSVGAVSATEQRVNYLTLLVAQLRNQNPLEPLDNNQMAMQLAQISQVEQLEKLNASANQLTTSFTDVLRTTEAKYAASLMGQRVTFRAEDVPGPVTERVTGVVLEEGGVSLRAGGHVVGVGDVLGIVE